MTMTLKAKKEKAAEVLKQNKKGLTEAKKRIRSHSHSKSSNPSVNSRKGKDRSSRK